MGLTLFRFWKHVIHKRFTANVLPFQFFSQLWTCSFSFTWHAFVHFFNLPPTIESLKSFQSILIYIQFYFTSISPISHLCWPWLTFWLPWFVKYAFLNSTFQSVLLGSLPPMIRQGYHTIPPLYIDSCVTWIWHLHPFLLWQIIFISKSE